MRIVIDKNIPLAVSAFKDLGNPVLLETTAFSRASVKDADILIIRSETKVDRTLLDGSRVRFVGTATIGTDHIDIPYLVSTGISFASAPGCNANSVKEYVLAALLTLSARSHRPLRGMTIGVVGVGNVGSKVVQVAGALGMSVLQNDPPLARTRAEQRFLPLEDLMGADIVTLHVPLTRTGEDATFHLFDAPRIAAMKPGSILLNTSRGAVVETGALKDALRRGHLSATVLDVWEGEPAIDVELLRLASLGTSHIAGYSLDGKVTAVRMIREALCRFLAKSPAWEPGRELPVSDVPLIKLRADGSSEEILRAAVRQCYDIELDDRTLRGVLDIPEETRNHYFMKLRSGYRVRREFFNTRVEVPVNLESVRKLIDAVGFR